MLSTDHAIPSNTTQKQHIARNILDEEVTVPHRSAVIVSVGASDIKTTQDIIEGNTLLLDRGLGIARGIARMHYGRTEVLVTNVSEKYRHVKKIATNT